MSIIGLQTSPPVPASQVDWKRVNESLWVASTPGGEFVGMVEAVGGRFRASDDRGIQITETADLRAGMAQVLHPNGRAYDRRRRAEPEPADLRMAQMTAVIAAAVCAASVIMLLTGLGSS
jgi:hypothetical protein